MKSDGKKKTQTLQTTLKADGTVCEKLKVGFGQYPWLHSFPDTLETLPPRDAARRGARLYLPDWRAPLFLFIAMLALHGCATWRALSNPLGYANLKAVIATGLVTLVEQRPSDAAWDHETFRIKPDNPDILGPLNVSLPGSDPTPYTGDPTIAGVIEVEPVVGSALPNVGDRVIVHGELSVNLEDGTTEIRPVQSWQVIP